MQPQRQVITVQVTINCPISKIWELWTSPEHITQWNSGHPDWHTPRATNDLRVGGKFTCRMEAKDRSMGFDFEGVYTTIVNNELIEYRIADGRSVKVVFLSAGSQTTIVESFETEPEHSIEQQQQGWQTILTNFKKYAEK